MKRVVGLTPASLTLLVMLAAAPEPAVAQSGTCELYPIALYAGTIQGVGDGVIVRDILNGVQPGNFGWLTWSGDGGTQVLTASLTPPGDSSRYVNPINPADGEISLGDWVTGRPGLDDSASVRAVLDNLEDTEITVPTWDAVSGTGSNSFYHISGFARIRITDYRLPKTDRITARYVKSVSCTLSASTNTAPAANNDTYLLVDTDFLDIKMPGVLANDRDPEGDSLTAVIETRTAHGSISLGSDGGFIYVSDPGYVGYDSFTYRAGDGSLNSNPATVTFRVHLTNDTAVATGLDGFQHERHMMPAGWGFASPGYQ